MAEGSTCCGCIPIRSGVITLAILGIIAGLWQFANGVKFLLASSDENVKVFVATAAQLGLQFQTQEDLDAFVDHSLNFVKTISIIYIILGIFDLILATVLLNGVHERKPNNLRVWVRVSVGYLIFTAVILLLSVASAIIVGIGILAISIGFVLAIVVPLQSYFIYVVYKYAGVMENENRPMHVVYQHEKP